MAAGDVAGDEDAATAATQLTLITTHFTARRTSTGTGAARTARSGPAHAPLPIDPVIVDHMQASVAEIVHATRTAAPHARPAPAEAAGVYRWMRDNTRDLDDHRQAEAETIVYRQTLEHAIAMGDHSVVRRHPCPACHCYGLFWRAHLGKAVCANHRCAERTEDGLARTWSLAHLADLHIQARNQSSRRAT